MKKLIFCIIAVYLQYSSLTYSWEVRVIPVYRDTMTGHWSGLFSHDIVYGWSEFRQKCFDEKGICSCISQMLSQQTNGAYIISPQIVEKIQSRSRLDNGDIIYCIPVEYISTAQLHKKMEESPERNLTNDKFAWIPIDEVLRHRTVVKVARGNSSLFVFDFDTRNIIKEFWPKKLLPALSADNPRKKHQPLQSETVKRYLEVKQNKIASKEINLQMQMKADRETRKNAKESKVVMVKGITPSNYRSK